MDVHVVELRGLSLSDLLRRIAREIEADAERNPFTGRIFERAAATVLVLRERADELECTEL